MANMCKIFYTWNICETFYILCSLYTLPISLTLTLYQYFLQNSVHHCPSLPPITGFTLGTTHHQLHPSPALSITSFTWGFFFFFGNPPLLLSAPPFLGHLHCHQLIHRLLVFFFFFPFYCQVGYLFGFLLRLGLAWLLLWAAVDGWDRL